MSECTEEVSRKGFLEPCGKVAVATRIDPTFGEPYPVCVYHTRADMVPLAEVAAKARETALEEAANDLYEFAQALTDEDPDAAYLIRIGGDAAWLHLDNAIRALKGATNG